MRKLKLWLLTSCTLCVAFIGYQGVGFMFVLNDGTTNDIATEGSQEPELAAAQSCTVYGNSVQSLNFGALVGPSSGSSSISMDTVGNLVADHGYSVGKNIDRYAPSYGAFSLQGSGLEVGKQFEVRFAVGDTGNGVKIDNLVFRLENVSNLQSIETDTNDNSLRFQVLGSNIYASLFYGATLTVDNSVRGSVFPPLLIEINGDQSCNL